MGPEDADDGFGERMQGLVFEKHNNMVSSRIQRVVLAPSLRPDGSGYMSENILSKASEVDGATVPFRHRSDFMRGNM